jgi:hypothetical protein
VKPVPADVAALLATAAPLTTALRRERTRLQPKCRCGACLSAQRVQDGVDVCPACERRELAAREAICARCRSPKHHVSDCPVDPDCDHWRMRPSDNFCPMCGAAFV